MSDLPYALTVEQHPKHIYFGQPISWIAGTDLARRMAEAPNLPAVYIGRDGHSYIDDRLVETEALLVWAELLVDQLKAAHR